MGAVEVLRYAAFSTDPAAGNPAGVVLDAAGLTVEQMQTIAADVGYSETAFLVPSPDGVFATRYFAPRAEVPFCGHATIAAGVALAERRGPGTVLLDTPAGRVVVDTEIFPDGTATATLSTVEPAVLPLEADDVEELLAALGWRGDELDPALPPRVGFAGAYHPILAAGTRNRLARLDYDWDRLGSLMAARGWTTVQLVWRQDDTTFAVRDPFPPGGVVEDPATGAAAAAFGAYLRKLRLVTPPVRLRLHQGTDLGRPSLLVVDVPPAGPIRVTGSAVAIPMLTAAEPSTSTGGLR